MKTKSIYIDMPSWKGSIESDDFIVSIGKKKTNSVYHVVEIRKVVPRENTRINRFYLSVINTDLLTALRRDQDQRLIPMVWYKRKSKQ